MQRDGDSVSLTDTVSLGSVSLAGGESVTPGTVRRGGALLLSILSNSTVLQGCRCGGGGWGAGWSS